MANIVKKRCNGVFEGGGVRGMGLVGALSEFEKAGYEFETLVGTSAGAIVSSLVAVGYSSEDIKEILLNTNYLDFKDKELLDDIPLVGKPLSLLYDFGIYEGKFFESWLETHLEKKGITTFGHPKMKNPDGSYRLQVVASDLTSKSLLVLPNDLSQFGYNPDEFSIAEAVRMSMSIPMFFEPYILEDHNTSNENYVKNHYIVDGGLLSNFPFWLLDKKPNQDIPNFGFKLLEDTRQDRQASKIPEIKKFVEYTKSIFTTMLEAHDKQHITESNGDYHRTIKINTNVPNESGQMIKIASTDFDITQAESVALYQNGVEGAQNFLESWSYDEWLNKYWTKECCLR